MIKDTDNFTDPGITETEDTGGFYEYQCPCGYEECDCLQRHEDKQGKLAEDDRLFRR